LSLAEAVRRVVADPEWPYDEDSIKISVTLSAGVATFPDDGSLLHELQDAATKNLAAARWAGGNQACHAFDPSRARCCTTSSTTRCSTSGSSCSR
jgi:GGDEF domain-containing protein